jgi:hypothetical protein
MRMRECIGYAGRHGWWLRLGLRCSEPILRAVPRHWQVGCVGSGRETRNLRCLDEKIHLTEISEERCVRHVQGGRF